MHNPWPKVVRVTAYMANKSEKSRPARLLVVHALYKHAPYRHAGHKKSGHIHTQQGHARINAAPPPLRIDRTDGGAGRAACR